MMSEETPKLSMKMEILQINAGIYQLIGLLPMLAEQAYNSSLALMDHVYSVVLERMDPLTSRLADITQEPGFADENGADDELWLIVNDRAGELSNSLESFRMEIARRWLIEGGPRPKALLFIRESIEAWFP